MEKRSTLIKLRVCVVVLTASILLGGFVPLFLHISYADTNCSVNDDVILLFVGGKQPILYWEERPCADGTSAVYYQIFSNNSWSDVKLLASFSPIDGYVQDFDGILEIGGKHLIASFAIEEGSTVKLLVSISQDNGQTWSSPPATVYERSNAYFLGWPTLTGQFNENYRVVSLLTTIRDTITGKGHVVLVRSRDLQNWVAKEDLGGENFPIFSED